MTKQLKKQFKNQSQSGRSMVEMLGVLAIIAILSIGGIVGYKLAMNYYQADQIANEINLMRNDLKVKYALGNEELLLGDPYDDTPENEHYSGHLSTQYDRYPVDYNCIRKDKAEFYNCRETDAYYIKVGNVSKGVCKPLITLVNAMDGLMYIEINKQVYKEDDLCDEVNEFYIQFDAEEVNGNYDSGRPEGWCAKDDDCDTSRPICDIENNECVECTEDADCSNNKPVCNIDLGNCEPCPAATPKWNGEECVECLSPADCTNPDEPKCEESTNTCEPCPKNSFWDGEKCQEGCKTNNHCDSDEYCKTKKSPCGDDCTEFCPASPSGTCTKLTESDYHAEPLDTGKVKLYVSKIPMNYESGLRFCEVLGRKLNIAGMTMASVADFECADPIDFSAENQVDCCHKVSIGRPDVCSDQVSQISDVAHHFAQKFPWDDYWLIESYTNKYICAKANLYTGENPQIPEWSNFDSFTPALKYELYVICK